MIWTLCEIIASLVEALIITMFTTKFLGFKNEKHHTIKYLACFVPLAVNITIVNYVVYSEALPAVLMLVITFVYAFFALKGSVYLKIMVVFLNCINLLIVNTAVLTLMSQVLNLNFEELAQMRNPARVVILISTKFLYGMCSLLIVKIRKGGSFTLTSTEWLCIIAMFFLTLLMGVLMFEAIWQQKYSEILMIIIVLCLSFLNIVTYYLLKKISRENSEKTRVALLELQLAEQKGRMFEINSMYHEILQIRHDMKKCISCASTLLSNGKYSEAQSYLLSVAEERIGSVREFVTISSDIVSAVINSKLSQCQNEGINEKHVICDCIGDISEVDLSILLANLLDNSIEACRRNQCPSAIQFTMQEYGGYLKIVIRNTLGGSSGNRTPSLITKKFDKKNHGFGVKTVREIAEKYEGMCDFYEENGEFVADVWLKNHSTEPTTP